LAIDRSDSLRSPPPPRLSQLARRRRCLVAAGFTFSSSSSFALIVTRLSLTCRFDANSLSTSAHTHPKFIHPFIRQLVRQATNKKAT